MSARGHFNTKSPTIKRILKEAGELETNASADFHATPLEDNLFEWHFTLRGPPEPSPYAKGIYHGRIVLPSEYPHRPPSFRFLTPSGRFEVNREICLSISGFHEETWQPAWGIRTALVAIRSFMDTGAAGQIGGLECDEVSRKKMAESSRAWKCSGCGHTNEEIIKQREELAGEGDTQGVNKEDQVPEELRLAYKDDLGGDAKKAESKGKEKATSPETPAPVAVQRENLAQSTQPVAQAAPLANVQPPPTKTIPAPMQQRQTAQLAPRNVIQAVPAWVDPAIYTLIAILAYLILRKLG